MKKLFIYYSLTGNGKMVANILKNKNYEIREVQTLRKLPKSFFWRMMIGGMLTTFNHKAKLIDYDNNINDYDEVVIGTPIWNGKVSCPINTVLKNTNFNNKKLTFILYSGGGEALKTVKKLKFLYECKIIEIKEPKKNDKLEEVLKEL